jgi:hypothetical protein
MMHPFLSISEKGKKLYHEIYEAEKETKTLS